MEIIVETKKVSNLNSSTSTELSDNDLLLVVDVDSPLSTEGELKRLSIDDFKANIEGSIGLENYAKIDLSNVSTEVLQEKLNLTGVIISGGSLGLILENADILSGGEL